MTIFDDQYAKAYDGLYMDKDYEKECDFLEALFEKYGYSPKTILDLGVKSKKVFFESVRKHSFKLPEDYKFNREELHER